MSNIAEQPTIILDKANIIFSPISRGIKNPNIIELFQGNPDGEILAYRTFVFKGALPSYMVTTFKEGIALNGRSEVKDAQIAAANSILAYASEQRDNLARVVESGNLFDLNREDYPVVINLSQTDPAGSQGGVYSAE